MSRNIKHIEIPRDETHKDILALLCGEDWQYIHRTVTDTTAVNTGKLFTAWVVLRINNERSTIAGGWYPARIWEPDSGERWILIALDERIDADSSGVAAQLWLELRNRRELKVDRELLQQNSNNEYSKYYRQFVADSERRRRELAADRASWN